MTRGEITNVLMNTVRQTRESVWETDREIQNLVGVTEKFINQNEENKKTLYIIAAGKGNVTVVTTFTW